MIDKKVMIQPPQLTKGVGVGGGYNLHHGIVIIIITSND